MTDVLGNSKTAERSAALEDVGIDPGRILQGLRDLASGQPVSVTRRTVNVLVGVKDRIATPANQSEAIASILTERDIKGLTKVLPVPKITSAGEPRSLQEALIRALASGQSGATEGR